MRRDRAAGPPPRVRIDPLRVVSNSPLITITGTDDAPVVTGSFTGAVAEGDAGAVAFLEKQIEQILANLCVNARDAIKGVGKIVGFSDYTSVGAEDRSSVTQFVDRVSTPMGQKVVDQLLDASPVPGLAVAIYAEDFGDGDAFDE